MALDAKKVYALCKKYTDDSVAGGGAIKGKNCVITSIAPITGGNRITFQWTLDNGTVQTDTLDVMNGINGTDGQDGTNGQDGTDGVGIASIDFKEKDTDGNNVYTVTYTDSNTDEIVCPIGPKGDDGVGVPDGGTTGQILAKNSNADGDTKWVDPSAASQVQSDFGENDSSKVSFIKNKPTKLSEFTNDEGFIKNTVDNLTEYYKKSETYTKSEVNTAIGNISTMSLELVNSLPTTDIQTNVIYLLPKSVGTGTSNIKEEYINLDGTTSGWELIGDTEIDLSNYIQKKSTAGLVKNDGDIDTTAYAKQSEMSVTDGTGADADKVTIQLKSGITATVLKTHQDISGKQDVITISGKKVNI